MSAIKGDTHIDQAYALLVVFIAVAFAIMYL